MRELLVFVIMYVSYLSASAQKADSDLLYALDMSLYEHNKCLSPMVSKTF